MTTGVEKKQSFDIFILVFALIEPITTLPQIYQVWSRHNVSGVSLVTWIFFTLAANVWLIYGIRIKDKPIIISSAMWVLTQGLVVIGILAR